MFGGATFGYAYPGSPGVLYVVVVVNRTASSAASSSSTVSAHLHAVRSAVGTGAGMGSVTAHLHAYRSATGTASAASAVAPHLHMLRSAAGSAAGGGTVALRLKNLQTTAGNAYSQGTVSDLLRSTKSAVGVAASSGTLAAHLHIFRSATGTAAAVGTTALHLHLKTSAIKSASATGTVAPTLRRFLAAVSASSAAGTLAGIRKCFTAAISTATSGGSCWRTSQDTGAFSTYGETTVTFAGHIAARMGATTMAASAASEWRGFVRVPGAFTGEAYAAADFNGAEVVGNPLGMPMLVCAAQGTASFAGRKAVAGRFQCAGNAVFTLAAASLTKTGRVYTAGSAELRLNGSYIRGAGVVFAAFTSVSMRGVVLGRLATTISCAGTMEWRGTRLLPFAQAAQIRALTAASYEGSVEFHNTPLTADVILAQ